MGPLLEPVAPLEVTANRWVAGSTRRNGCSGMCGESSEMVNARTMFMLEDVIELRDRKWIPRIAVPSLPPTTIAQVGETAAKEKQQAHEKGVGGRTLCMSRGGNRDAAEAHRWSVAVVVPFLASSRRQAIVTI